MWDSCPLPQGPPRWVLLKGSPHSLVGKRLQEVFPSLQIHHCPSAVGQLSHSCLLQHPAGCVTWFFLSSWGRHNQYSTPFDCIKNQEPEATAVTALTLANRTRAPHLPQAGVFQAPNLSLAYVNCGIIHYDCCSPS